jgi:hypothetical protein
MGYVRAPASLLLAFLAALGCDRPSDKPAEASETATLPASFPTGLPVYPGARLVSAGDGILDGGRPVHGALLESKDGIDAVSAFYEARFKDYRRYATPEITPTTRAFYLTEDNRHLDLILGLKKSGDKTVIDLRVSPF